MSIFGGTGNAEGVFKPISADQRLRLLGLAPLASNNQTQSMFPQPQRQLAPLFEGGDAPGDMGGVDSPSNETVDTSFSGAPTVSEVQDAIAAAKGAANFSAITGVVGGVPGVVGGIAAGIASIGAMNAALSFHGFEKKGVIASIASALNPFDDTHEEVFEGFMDLETKENLDPVNASTNAGIQSDAAAKPGKGNPDNPSGHASDDDGSDDDDPGAAQGGTMGASTSDMDEAEDDDGGNPY